MGNLGKYTKFENYWKYRSKKAGASASIQCNEALTTKQANHNNMSTVYGLYQECRNERENLGHAFI